MDIDADTSPTGPTATRRVWAHRGPGQVIIILAFSMVAIIGVLGLAADLGYIFVGRRAMQNAADAGALAGARIVSQSTTAHPLSAFSEVQTIVGKNTFGGASPTLESCVYVNDAEDSLGNCSETVPLHTTGVKVVVSETHSTFFMRAIPFAPKSASSSASSTAHVQILAKPPSDGPFIVCATNTVVANTSPPQTMSILTKSSDGTWIVNPSLVNTITNIKFLIHGPQIAKCGSGNSSFKGFADGGSNLNKIAPTYFTYNTGDAAGQVTSNVQGIDGCQANQPVVNCVAILPIAVVDPSHPALDNANSIWVVAYAPFYITADGANGHDGVLMTNYVVTGPSAKNWETGYSGPIVIKLTK